MKRPIAIRFAVVIFVALFLVQGCSGFRASETENAEDQTKVAEAISNFKNSDPGIKVFFEKAYGYAVFPSVAKGGAGIGGAYGRGEVFENGNQIGYSSVTQLTFGFQLGGQVYSEIIFFKSKKTLDDFKNGNFEFGAQVSAVAITIGVSADADYNNGVAIFTIAKGGLMYEASIGGQKFSFHAN